MTAEDQAAPTEPAEPGAGRAAARSVAREALNSGRRQRAAGDRREQAARAEQVRRARAAAEEPPDAPTPTPGPP